MSAIAIATTWICVVISSALSSASEIWRLNSRFVMMFNRKRGCNCLEIAVPNIVQLRSGTSQTRKLLDQVVAPQRAVGSAGRG